MYTNNYRETRCKFIVGEIKNMRIKKRNEQKDIVVLTLRFKNPKEDPRYGSSLEEVFYWSARYTNCRLEKPGPPNQLFFIKKNPQKARRKQLSSVTRGSSRRASRKCSRRDANEDDESYINIQDIEIENQTKNNKNNGQNDIELLDRSDPESDIEIGNEDTKEKDHDRNDRYYVQWDDNFVDNISIDNRKVRGCTESRATLNGILTTNYHFLSASSLFYMLSPTEYFEEHLIQATNQELLRAHDKELTLGEFYCWL